MAPTPLRTTLVHRLPKAVLIAIAVAIAGGGAVGFAAAADDGAIAFSLPTPMVGDQAQYEPIGEHVFLVERDAPEEPRLVQVSGPHHLLLPDGRGASVATFRVSQNQTSGDDLAWVAWREAYLDLSSGEVVASAASNAVFRGSSGTSGPAGLDSHLVVNQRASELLYAPGPVPCGSLNGLQGRTAPAGERIWVAGCFADEDRRDFAVVGIEPLDGVDSLVLAQGPVRLWFQGGIPYPVQMHITPETPGPGSGGLWRMSGFVRGTVALEAGHAPAPLAMPGIEFAPVSRFGPDASGIDLPFTLQQAYDQASSDAQVAAFQQAHPDHYVTKADLYQDIVHDTSDPSGARSEARWVFTLRGTGADLRVSVLQPRDSGQPVDVDRLLDEGPFAEPDEGAVSAREQEQPDLGADCRPAALPTVDSVARLWRRLNGDGRPATGYGFTLGCETNLDVVAEVDAGDAYPGLVASYGGPPFVLPPDEVHRRLGGLVVLADGTPSHQWLLDVTTSGESWAELPSTTPDSAGGTSPRPAPTPAWSVPAGPVAASITVVSILAALAYWLWPVLKAGPLALFTRLEAPELLDHPMRKELVQRIEAQPGVHYQDLVRAMGKGKGTIEHHLRKLEEGGLVKSVPAGGYTCFFPVAYDRRLAAAAPALKSEGARKVLAAIRANPGSSALQIGAATGLSPASINHHLQRLGAAGLVDVLRNGRSLCLQPTALAGQVAMGEPAAT